MNEELERRYRAIIEQYSKLLREWLELFPQAEEARPVRLPPFPAVAVFRNECPLRQSSPDQLRLLVGPGKRVQGLRELRDFTANTTRLTILDPYFFSGAPSRANDIAEDFKRTARIQQGCLKAVQVVRNDCHDEKTVLAAMRKVISAARMRLTLFSTGELHDRVWIADGLRAVVVGTSLNGLGSRAAFILALPKADLDAILEFLYSRGLALGPRCRTSSSRARSKA